MQVSYMQKKKCRRHSDWLKLTIVSSCVQPSFPGGGGGGGGLIAGSFARTAAGDGVWNKCDEIFYLFISRVTFGTTVLFSRFQMFGGGSKEESCNQTKITTRNKFFSQNCFFLFCCGILSHAVPVRILKFETIARTL